MTRHARIVTPPITEERAHLGGGGNLAGGINLVDGGLVLLHEVEVGDVEVHRAAAGDEAIDLWEREVPEQGCCVSKVSEFTEKSDILAGRA